MVNGPRLSPHTEADFRALQRGTGGGGTGNHPFPVPQNHLPVGADVHQQCTLLLPVKAGCQNAPHRIRPHIAGNIRHGDERRVGTAGENVSRLPDLSFGQHRGKGNFCQIFRHNSQKQLLHTGIPHHADNAHRFRQHPGLTAGVPQQGPHLLPDEPGLGFHLPRQRPLDAADDIRAVALLGIHGRGRRQKMTGSRFQKVAHHGGSPDVESRHCPIPQGLGFYLCPVTVSEYPGVGLGCGYVDGHVP